MSAAPKLCPWLVEAKLGTWVVRGRARFPEGVARPTATTGGEYCTGGFDSRTRKPNTTEIPAGAIAWSGESFEIRYEGVRKGIIETIESDVMYAMYEGGTRPVDAHGHRDGECRYRIDSFAWEAPPELEDRLSISGTAGDLISREGVPVAVEFTGRHPDDFESIAPAFRAVFAGVATLGPWELTPSDEGRDTFDGRAEVEWHGPGWSVDTEAPRAVALARRALGRAAPDRDVDELAELLSRPDLPSSIVKGINVPTRCGRLRVMARGHGGLLEVEGGVATLGEDKAEGWIWLTTENWRGLATHDREACETVVHLLFLIVAYGRTLAAMLEPEVAKAMRERGAAFAVEVVDSWGTSAPSVASGGGRAVGLRTR